MQAYWDVQIYAKHQEVRVNSVDACIINQKTKQVITLEMSCPWARNWEEKSKEKTLKYRPLRWELKQRYLGYTVPHHNNYYNRCAQTLAILGTALVLKGKYYVSDIRVLAEA